MSGSNGKRHTTTKLAAGVTQPDREMGVEYDYETEHGPTPFGGSESRKQISTYASPKGQDVGVERA
jgi:hypothetical protein